MEALMKKFGNELKWEKFKWEVDSMFAKYKDDPNPLASNETEKQIRVGAVLKLKNGTFELVGSVNRLLGVCDDCTNFNMKDIAEIAYLT